VRGREKIGRGRGENHKNKESGCERGKENKWGIGKSPDALGRTPDRVKYTSEKGRRVRN